jgi:hypothetical protein
LTNTPPRGPEIRLRWRRAARSGSLDELRELGFQRAGDAGV